MGLKRILVSLVRESPHLAAFVKRLVYRFPCAWRRKRTDIGNHDLASALSKLVNVTELHLEASEPPKTPSDTWREVEYVVVFEKSERLREDSGADVQLLRIMERSATKTLRLRNLNMSIQHFVSCSGIERFELHDTLITGPSDCDWFVDQFLEPSDFHVLTLCPVI